MKTTKMMKFEKGLKRVMIVFAVAILIYMVLGTITKVLAHDPEAEATELMWRSEGTIPETWASAWHRTTIPQGESWEDAIIISHTGDGSVRVRYKSGPPACVWEAPSLRHKVGGGRTLAQFGDEGWMKAGFGGVIYGVAGRTCEGFDIQLCTGIC